ncbi:MAG: pyrrolo-quinoline quinone, partial [Verrucomicrobiota bacterium]
MMKTTVVSLAAVAFGSSLSPAADWAEWGGSATKNMVSPVTNLPTDFSPGEGQSEEEIANSATHLRWVAKLGSQTYGTPTIGAGKVLVGTNNEEPRNEAIKGDRGVVMCFDEKTGAYQWQLTTPKLGAGKVSDWEFLGMCSSALIDAENNAGYVVTNRGEVVAFDLDGLANGNDGEFQLEGKYMAGGLDGLDTAT